MRRVANLNDLAAMDAELTNNPYLQGLSPPNSNNPRQNNKQNTKKSHDECSNPENQWIVELFQEKLSNASGNKQNAYIKAIRNIKKCPSAITNEHDAIKINGIGQSFARIIKQKLIQRQKYLSQHPNQSRYNAYKQMEKKNEKQQSNTNKKPKKKRKKTEKKPYTPRVRSGGYALLIHMFISWKNGLQGFTKDQLLRDAQQYADASFTESKRGGDRAKYTAWSAMTKLEEKNYVKRINHGNNGHTFYLQPAGTEIAEKLYNEMQRDVLPEYMNEEKQSNHRKRKNSDMMELDDEIQRPSKRQRIEYNMNNNNNGDVDVRKPILINGEYYKVYLIYDNQEETNKKGRNEKVTLKTQFEEHERINSKQMGLSIGDFCWILRNINNENEEYLIPIIVERKRKDDLIKSIEDKRYIEQKFRIKKNAKDYRHIYLIEDYHIYDEVQKKRLIQSLINTEVRDGFIIYHTSSLIECIRVLSKWTFLIYQQILNTLSINRNNNNYNFFRSERYELFSIFNKSMDCKKNGCSAKVLFGRQLMSIPGVTDKIASAIINKYPTMKCLYNEWKNKCDHNEQKQKLLLFNNVNGTCLEWHRDIDSGLIELDQDLKNVCSAINDNEVKHISAGLSEKIWNCLYNVPK